MQKTVLFAALALAIPAAFAAEPVKLAYSQAMATPAQNVPAIKPAGDHIVPAIPTAQPVQPAPVAKPVPAAAAVCQPCKTEPKPAKRASKPVAKPVAKPAQVIEQIVDAAPSATERVRTTADLVQHTPPLQVSDRVRLEASRKWEREGVADALVGTGGQVEYAYGQSRPTIACAPLHVCTIQLIEGEAITSLSLGDTVRWLAQATTAGERPVVVVKPTQPGIATNLVLTTDKGRVYYLHLVASKTDYVPMVGFYDPAALIVDMREQAARVAEAKARAEALAAAAKAKREQAVVDQVAGPGFDPTKLDFGYSCKGPEELKPVRVFANATHTYLQMPPEIKAMDAPAVFNVTPAGTELLNTRYDKSYYIVDGKPARLQLALGVGDKARVVECSKAGVKSESKPLFSFGE